MPSTSDSRPHLNRNIRPRISCAGICEAFGEALVFFALAYGSVALGIVGLFVATIVLVLQDGSSKVMVNEAYKMSFKFFNDGYVWRG